MLEPTAVPIPVAAATSSGSRADSREAGADGFALVLALVATNAAAAPGAAASPEPRDGERGAPTPAFEEDAGPSPGAFSPRARPGEGAQPAAVLAGLGSRPATVADGAPTFDEGAECRFAGLAGAVAAPASPTGAAIVGTVSLADTALAPAPGPQPHADTGATAAATTGGWQGRSPIGTEALDPGAVAAEVSDDVSGSTEAENLTAADAGGEARGELGLTYFGSVRPIAPPDRIDADGFAAEPAVASVLGFVAAARPEPVSDPTRADDAAVAGGPDVTGGTLPSREASPVSMATRATSPSAAHLAARGSEFGSAGARIRSEADAATSFDTVAIDAGVPVDLAPRPELDNGRPVGDSLTPPRYLTSTSQAPTVQIAAALLQRDGAPVDRLQVTLQPAELGAVEVTLTSEGRRKTRALVLVDRPETLELLRREQPTLERILIASGLELEAGGLEFGLRREGERRGGPFAPPTAEPIAAEPGPRTNQPAPARLLDLRLLDLVV
jgi:flagellar hook-length control protein FliK